MHAIQQSRKDAGLEITDRIALSLGGDAGLLEAAGAHERYIAAETLATSVAYAERDDWLSSVEIDGRELKILLSAAA